MALDTACAVRAYQDENLVHLVRSCIDINPLRDVRDIRKLPVGKGSIPSVLGLGTPACGRYRLLFIKKYNI